MKTVALLVLISVSTTSIAQPLRSATRVRLLRGCVISLVAAGYFISGISGLVRREMDRRAMRDELYAIAKLVEAKRGYSSENLRQFNRNTAQVPLFPKLDLSVLDTALDKRKPLLDLEFLTLEGNCELCAKEVRTSERFNSRAKNSTILMTDLPFDTAKIANSDINGLDTADTVLLTKIHEHLQRIKDYETFKLRNQILKQKDEGFPQDDVIQIFRGYPWSETKIRQVRSRLAKAHPELSGKLDGVIAYSTGKTDVLGIDTSDSESLIALGEAMEYALLKKIHDEKQLFGREEIWSPILSALSIERGFFFYEHISQELLEVHRAQRIVQVYIITQNLDSPLRVLAGIRPSYRMAVRLSRAFKDVGLDLKIRIAPMSHTHLDHAMAESERILLKLAKEQFPWDEP